MKRYADDLDYEHLALLKMKDKIKINVNRSWEKYKMDIPVTYKIRGLLKLYFNLSIYIFFHSMLPLHKCCKCTKKHQFWLLSCSHRDQIDKGHCVVVDAPQCHDTDGVHGDHDYGDEVEKTRSQVQAQQQTAHHEGRHQTLRDGEESLRHDGQVLLVEDISHPWRRTEDKYWSETTQSLDLKVL